jgi:hypothetical protein
MASTLSQIRALYSWNDKAQRWMVRGRFVSESSLKLALVQYAAAAGQEVKELAGQMARGELPLPDWQLATADRIKNGTLAMELAAKGGRLTARDYGRIGARLRTHYAYLQRFALDVEAGRLSPGQIVARASLYAAGFNGAYERARRDHWEDLAAAGVRVEARSILAVAEHCEAGAGRPGCAEEAARGWVPLETMSTPGTRRCLAACKCRLEYREAA